MRTIRVPFIALLIVLATVPLRAEDVVVSFTALVYRFFENAGTGGVTVTRTGSPLASLSIPYHYVIDTTVTDGTFTFAPNETSKTFLLPVPNDGVFDNANSEFQNYYVELRPVFPVIGGSILHTRIQLMEAQPEPVISISSVSVAEGNSGSTLAHFTVSFNAPFKRDATLFWSAEGSTATVGSDFDNPTPNFVPLPAGQTSKDVFIKINGDQSPEPDEIAYVYASADGYGFRQNPGVLTILNDDYILTPESQRIARGTVGSASVATSVATPTTDRVTLSSSNPNVVTVPPFVDVPAGSLGKAFEITAVNVGSAVITATAPPSRGSATTTTQVDVYSSAFFYFEKPSLALPLAQTTTATMHFEPPPTEPVPLFLAQTNPAVAAIPAFFTVGTNGIGTFTVHGTGVGNTVITAMVPAVYGGGSPGFSLDVTPAAGVAISRVDPVSGPSSGGQHVTIYAAGMSTRCSAMFDGVSGLNTSTSSSGLLTTDTPPHDPGAVDVSVRCGDDVGTLPKAYTFTSAPSRLTRLSPTIGAAGGGMLVTATGENLRRGRCTLWFGGVPATTEQNDQTTTMLVTAPPHAPGSVDVALHCGSDVSTLAGAFLYTGSEMLPQLSGINPPSAAAGDRVILGGSAFRGDDVILFDGVPGLDMTSTSDQHLVTIPDLPPGNATITLRDVAGHIAAGPPFRVLASIAPQITSAPTRVLTSSELQITGSGFKRSLNFLLGSTVLQQVSVASTFALLRLPDSITPGTYPLTIANQSVSPRSIQVTDSIAVMSVSIPCSSTEGGSFVTIAGKGFTAGAVVTFGAADSTDVTVRDPHTIVARVPPSSGHALDAITVTNPNGDTARLSNAFRYLWPDPGCGATRHRGAAH